jgi:TolB-like protein
VNRARTILPVSLLLVAAACSSGGGGKAYLHPNADLGSLKTVAVLPFENLTQERTSGEKVQRIFLTELLSMGLFEVVEPGLVTKTLRAEHVESTDALAPADVQRIAKALKADALFMGTVVDFADNRNGSTPAPEVTIHCRLVEGQSGVTIWSSNRSRSGASVSARLFGVGGLSLTEAARKLIREELRTLTK